MRKHILFLLMLMLSAILLATSCTDNKHKRTFYKYKVTCLEGRNMKYHAFSPSLYNPGDTVWVNQTTLKIDHPDSLALAGVIDYRVANIYFTQEDIDNEK